MDLRRTKQRMAREEDLAMREMKCKRNEGGTGLDLISELPDPLICLILSRLPFNEAVTTSVISPRWKNLWKGVSRVEFDPTRIKPWRIDKDNPPIRKRMGFNRFRDREGPSEMVSSEPVKKSTIPLKNSTMKMIDEKMVSLLLHDNITSCSVIHFLKSGIFNFLSKLNCLEQLSLTCKSTVKKMEISQGFFQGNKLSSLQLTNYKVGDGLLEGFVNLNTLTLTRVVLVDENITLSEILRRCPRLKNLVLDSSPTSINSSHKELIVRSDKLNCIKLQNMSQNFTYNIECPNLKELSVTSYKDGHVRHTLEKCSGLGQEIGAVKPIKDLHVLCTTLDLNNHIDIVVLAYILDAWKNLQNIDITSRIGSLTEVALPYENYLEFWDQIDLPKCISYQLRIVKIRGFRGKGQEISFASTLIRKASRLKQLVIECDDKCSRREAFNTFDLLGVRPRVSDTLSITLKPGKRYMSSTGDDFQQWISSLE